MLGLSARQSNAMAAEGPAALVRSYLKHAGQGPETFDAFTKALGELREVEVTEDLRLDEFNLLIDGLDAIPRTALGHLSIVAYFFTPPMIKAISRILDSTPSLRSIDFSGSRFVDGGETEFLTFLQADKKLIRLQLAHCNIEGDKIAMALSDHPKLLCLDLGYVTLTHKGLKHLLTNLPVLRYLDARADADARALKVALTDVGASRWCAALGKNRTLTHLCLRRHNMGLDAGIHLARAIAANQCLQHLDISFNPDMGPAVDRFAEALKVNKTLLEFSLNGAFISDGPAKALADVLERDNRTLQSIQLATHGSSMINVQRFVRALEKNWALLYFSFNDELNGHPFIQKYLKRNRNVASMVALVAGFHPRLGRTSPLQRLADISPGLLRSVGAFVMG